MSQTETHENNRAQRTYNLTLAAVAGQVGCLTLTIIVVALFGGLWIDSRLDTRPLATIILMIASVPITLVAMFWVVKKATGKIKFPSPPEPESESNLTQEDA
ncbi:MAG: AtpZ/AtpI family protein [Chloroflexota bacterium]